MDTSTDSSPSSDRLPGWLVEALDVLSARRRIVVATAVGIVLLGGIVAVVAPSILPARAIVGAAVGIAAALLATAVALAMDASDLVVRGARHVRAAGGTIDVRVGRQHDDVGPLLAAVARHARDGRVRVALAPASRSAGVPGARAAALAEALARTGRKVLLTDLTRGGTPAAGLSDVIAGNRTLAEVVRFEHELYLARLAVGSDPDAALSGFAQWVEALPSDLEVLVAALPPLAEKGVLSAAGALDLTLVLVEVDRTERVDLIASLDAVDASGVSSELVLVDPARTVVAQSAGAPAPATPAESSDVDDDHDTDDRPEDGAAAHVDEPADAVAHDTDVEDAEVRDDERVTEPAGEPTGHDEVDDADESAGAPMAVFADEDAHAAAFDDVPDAWTPAPVGADDDVTPDLNEDLPAEFGIDEPTSGSAAQTSPHLAPSADGADGHDDDLDHDPDATAEIGPFLDGDDDSIIDDDEPAATPPAAPSEPAPAPTASTEPAPTEPAPVAPPDEPVHADDPADPAPADPAPAEGRPADDERTRHTPAGGDHDTSPATTWQATPRPDPATREPAAATSDQPSAPAPARPADPSEPSSPHLDPASLEVARASAALHQLAQQIWDRDEA